MLCYHIFINKVFPKSWMILILVFVKSLEEIMAYIIYTYKTKFYYLFLLLLIANNP